jgi:hypothetical protein
MTIAPGCATAAHNSRQGYPSIPAGIQAYIHVESSAPVFDVLYRYGQNIPAADGAYGANIGASPAAWFIEEQRAGGLDVIAGALRNQPAIIADGLKMFHYGLTRETASGAFPGSAWPFHGAAMFLAEAAPSLLFLRYSSYASEFRSEIRWDALRMKQAALHMVSVVGGVGHIDDTTKNHRYYEAALALEATGLLAHDTTLQRWSTLYVREGMRMEQTDGVMPENGGHDTGYQALGMTYAARYLELRRGGLLVSRLYQTLKRGEDWELARVRPDGTIDQTGDTRSTGCKERNPQGQCKTTMYAPIFNALARWSVISGDAHFQRAARLVWQRQSR